MERIVFFNEKGGVGKTTLSVHVAYDLAVRHDKRVLLVDLDPQGNATLNYTSPVTRPDVPEGVYCRDNSENKTSAALLLDPEYDPKQAIHVAATIGGVQQIKNLFLMPSDKAGLVDAELGLGNKDEDRFTRLHSQLEKLDDYFDYAIIDCSPSIANQTNINSVYAADTLVMPIDTSSYSAIGIQATLNILSRLRNEKVNEYTVVVKTNIDGRNKKTNEFSDALTSEIDVNICPVPLRICTAINQCTYSGQTLFSYAPRSQGCKDFKAITKYLMEFHND